MKRTIFFVFMFFPVFVIGQNNNCDYSDQTIELLKKAQKEIDYKNEERSYTLEKVFRIKFNLNAMYYLSSALKNNPDCEDIKLTLAEVYLDLTLDEQYLVRNPKKLQPHITEYNVNSQDPQFFARAKDLLNDVILNSDDISKKEEAKQLLLKANNIIEVIEKQKELDDQIEKNDFKKEKTIVSLRDHSTFLSIGIGTGFSYGTIGIKGSLFTAPNGFFFTGSYGTNKTKWSVGGGYSVGKYKTNFQLQFLYGNRSYEEINWEYVKSVNMSGVLNFDIAKNFGISVDGGGWVPLKSEDIVEYGGSIGVYYKF